MIYTIIASQNVKISSHIDLLTSLQKRAMHTKKSVYCDNDSILNLVHTKNFSVRNLTGVSGGLHHN